MIPRNRLLATFRGELPDRVPVSPFVQEEYLSFYYPEKRQVDRVDGMIRRRLARV